MRRWDFFDEDDPDMVNSSCGHSYGEKEMNESYIISYFGDKFTEHFFKEYGFDYLPTQPQLERFIMKWVLEHAGKLTIAEVAELTLYVMGKIPFTPNKYATNIQLEVVDE